MSETETPANDNAKQPKIDHGKPHPNADSLVARLFAEITANPVDPSKVLEFLGKADIEDVRIACLRTMTAPWSLASEPLIESLSDDQTRGVLAAIVVGYYQGRFSQQQKTGGNK